MTDSEKIQSAKIYLSRIRKTDRLIQRLCETSSNLRRGLTSIGCEIKPDKVQSSSAVNPLEDAIGKIVDLEAEINSQIDVLVELKQDIVRRIHKVPNADWQTVLLARYVDGLRWEEISETFHYSVRQVHRMNASALLEFCNQNLKDVTLCHTLT